MYQGQQEVNGHINKKLIINSIYIQVKFACRCFLEYEINKQLFRTKQIRVDSKNNHYDFNQSLDWPKQQQFSRIGNQQLKVLVKLLSSKGLSFTVGYIDINQHILNRFGNTFQLKVCQSQGMEARCTFQYIKKQTSSQDTPYKLVTGFNILSNENIDALTNSSKSKSIKFQQQLEQLQDDCNHLKDKFQKYEQCSFQKNKNMQFSYPKRGENHHKAHQLSTQYLMQRNHLLSLRNEELQRELIRNNELYEKQKEIVRIFEGNLKDKIVEYEQLRNINKQITTKYDDLKKLNYQLEEQKIKYQMEQLKNEKQKSNLGQYMTHMLEQVYSVVQNIFKRRINNLTSISLKQLNKNSPKQNLTSPSSPIRKLFASTDLRHCEQQFQNQIGDISISDEFSLHQKKSLNSISKNLMSNIFKQLGSKETSRYTQQCIETVKRYCLKIQKIVNQYVQKLFQKIIELSSCNQAYKKKLTQEKAEFQNNQESLIGYLQQLQDGLETQLAIAKEKDIEIFQNEDMISSLNELLLEKQMKIRELEEICQHLQSEKIEIKGQLHQNNYLYATREEELLHKMVQLQNRCQMYAYNQEAKRLNVFKRKGTLRSEDDGQQEDYQEGEFQMHPVPKSLFESIRPEHQKENELRSLDYNEDNLRRTMLKKQRQSLAKKLREQMEGIGDANSIDEEDKSQTQSLFDKEKGMEEEFLKILV